MLKKLKSELDYYGISEKSLTDGTVLDLPYSPSTICKKIKGTNKKEFNSDDKKDIYLVLKSKGYHGTLEELFIQSDYDSSDIPRIGWLADIINKRIFDLGYEGKIIEKFRQKGIILPEATLSDWRSGKVKTIRNFAYLDTLAEILNTDVRYLLGDRKYANNGYDTDISNEVKSINAFYDSLLKLYIDLVKYDDPVYAENADLFDKLFDDLDFKKLFINEIIHDNYPIGKRFIERWFSEFGDSWLLGQFNRNVVQKTDIKKTKWYLLNKKISRKSSHDGYIKLGDTFISKKTVKKHGEDKIMNDLNKKKGGK